MPWKAARDAVISWFKTTLSTRLNDKREGIIILVMQRLHVDDLVGHILESEGEYWVQLNLPAIADDPQEIEIGNGRVHIRNVGDVLQPDREPLEVLHQLKATMGSAAFAAQYQQRPVPPEGNLIRTEWLRSYDFLPEKESLDRIVQSWDCAAKSGELNDYSVCLTFLMRKNEFYLIDALRRRLSTLSSKSRSSSKETSLRPTPYSSKILAMGLLSFKNCAVAAPCTRFQSDPTKTRLRA
jgi:hypothetical protein